MQHLARFTAAVDAVNVPITEEPDMGQSILEAMAALRASWDTDVPLCLSDFAPRPSWASISSPTSVFLDVVSSGWKTILEPIITAAADATALARWADASSKARDEMVKHSRATEANNMLFAAGPKTDNVKQLWHVSDWLVQCNAYLQKSSPMTFETCIGFEKDFQTFVKPLGEMIDGWGQSCFEEFCKSPLIHPESGVFAEVIKCVHGDGEKVLKPFKEGVVAALALAGGTSPSVVQTSDDNL
eukprot:3187835-Pyramimonas_sp.AAC.1